MRHLPAITLHLCHVLSPVQASRHTHRHLLLAGRRDVTHYVIWSRDVNGGQHANGLLRHNNVIRHATDEKGFLYSTRGGHWLGTPCSFYRHLCFTII